MSSRDQLAVGAIESKPSPSIASNVAWTGLAQGVGLALGFVSGVVLARWLGPESRGIYALIITTASLFGTVLGNGSLLSAMTFFVGKRLYSSQRIIGHGLWFAVLSTAVAAVAIALLPPALTSTLFPDIGRSDLWLSLGMATSLLLSGVLNGVLVGLDEIRLSAIVDTVRPALVLILQLILLGALQMGLTGARWQIALLSLWNAVAAAALLLWRAGIDLRPDIRLTRDIASYGGKLYPGYIGSFLLARADLYFVASLVGSAATGTYAVAIGLATLLALLEMPISQAVAPKVVSMDRKAAATTSSDVFRLVFWVCTAAAFVGAVLAPWLIPLVYGQEYQETVPVFVLLLPGVVFRMTRMLGPYFSLQLGRPEIPTLLALSAGVVSLPLFYWLTSLFGGPGAALASSIASGLRAAATIWLFARFSEESVASVLVLRKRDLLLLWKHTGQRVLSLLVR